MRAPSFLSSKPQFPLHWRVAAIDPRFGVTSDQVREAVEKAAHTWEKAAHKELFEYDPTAGFPVQLIYDRRQEIIDGQKAAKVELDAADRDLKAAKKQSKSTEQEFLAGKERVRAMQRQLDEAIASYNHRVGSWNSGGGAPDDAANELEQERQGLEVAQNKVASAEDDLRELRKEAVDAIDRYNVLVEQYNAKAVKLNAKFHTAGTAVIGECRRAGPNVDSVTIYAFKDTNHLAILLAHELGHAIGVEHVPGDTSIMSAVEKGKRYPTSLELTAKDVAALKKALS